MRNGTDILSDIGFPSELRTATPCILVAEDKMTGAILIEDIVKELSFEIVGVDRRGIPLSLRHAYGGRGIPAELRGHLVLGKPFGLLELGRALLTLTGRT